MQFCHQKKSSNLYEVMFVKSIQKVHSSRPFHIDSFHVCQTSKKFQDIFSTWQNVELMKHFSVSKSWHCEVTTNPNSFGLRIIPNSTTIFVWSRSAILTNGTCKIKIIISTRFSNCNSTNHFLYYKAMDCNLKEIGTQNKVSRNDTTIWV